MRRVSNYQTRTYSPIKSPMKSPNRALSPIRRSPFRQAPLSPLRSRRFERTPKKHDYQQNQKLFYRSPRNKQYTNGNPVYFNYNEHKNNEHKNNEKYQSNINHQEQNSKHEQHYMQKTIKRGVGLFQQLAHQNKLNSDKKQNKNGPNGSNTRNYVAINTSHQTQPFESSARKKQNSAAQQYSQFGNMNPKNTTFASLLQNVKQIESIQGYHPCNSNVANNNSKNTSDKNSSKVISYDDNTLNLSFKTYNHSNKAMTQPLAQQAINTEKCIMESFGNLETINNESKIYSEITLCKNKTETQFQKKSPQSQISPHYSDRKTQQQPQSIIPSISEYNGVQRVQSYGYNRIKQISQNAAALTNNNKKQNILANNNNKADQSEDYDDVLYLIKKVSDNMNNNHLKSSLNVINKLNQHMQESVNASFKDQDSFNMNPFL